MSIRNVESFKIWNRPIANIKAKRCCKGITSIAMVDYFQCSDCIQSSCNQCFSNFTSKSSICISKRERERLALVNVGPR